MRRREFVKWGASAAAVWPLVARAQQQPPTPIIGYLASSSLGPSAPNVDAFRQGLSHTDYVEGRNVAIEYRWADGNYDRCPHWLQISSPAKFT